MSVKSVWDSGVEEEVAFWRRVFSGDPPEFLEDMRARLNPAAPLVDYLVTRLPAGIDIEDVAILDVGAGPISMIGWHVEGRRPKITPIDALAPHYRALLDEFGHVPPAYTQACDGEKISAKFGANSFDIVHMRNALDHCYDAMAVVGEMLTVAKPGGAIVITGNVDEAVFEKYAGLHQWNIRVDNGDMIVWRPGERHNVRETLADRIRGIEAASKERWMWATIWKR